MTASPALTSSVSRRALAALTTAALIAAGSVGVQRVAAADDWDFVYGSAGVFDFSEYESVTGTPDGGAILLGRFSGEFEGLIAGAAYLPFAQFRDATGVTQWTTLIDPVFAPCLDFPNFLAVESDPDGVVYAWVEECELQRDGNEETVKVIASIDSSGVRETIRMFNMPPNGGTGTEDWSRSFAASPAGGLHVALQGEQFATATGIDATTLWSLNADLETNWSYKLPDEFGDLTSRGGLISNSLAVAEDGTTWVVDAFPKPLPTLNGSVGMLKVTPDGLLETSILHYGLGFSDDGGSCGYPKVVRVTNSTIWVQSCGPAEGGRADGNFVRAFDVEDGELLGIVSEDGLLISDLDSPNAGWDSRDDFRNGSFRFTTDGSRASFTVPWWIDPEFVDVRHAIFEVTGDVEETTWELVVSDQVENSTEINDVVIVGGNEYISVGSALPSSPAPLMLHKGAATPATAQQAMPLNPGAFITRTRIASLLSFPAGGVLRVNVAEAVGGKTVFGQLAVAQVTGAGFVTAYGCDDGIPRDGNGNINKSDLNYDGQVTPVTSNRLIVKADNDGDICFYTLAPAEMIVDINGVTNTGITAIANQRTDTR